VLELGRFIAVPICGQLLAEGGADVIKVEDLNGDQSRHNGEIIPFEGRQFCNKNRGKRSLSVNLSDPGVTRAVQSLAARSDIVLANFRPGLSHKLGLDYESVSRENPAVIYAENTAYGSRGPMSETAGMDIVIQAFTGIAQFGDTGPAPLENPMIDYTAALLMAFGVSTALFHRERTGHGQKLDTALLQAAMFMENNQLTHIDAIDDWREPFVEHLKQAFVEGETWAGILRRRDELLPHRVMRAYYGFFETSDGTIAVACNPRALRLRMLDVLGIEDRWTTEPGWIPDNVEAHEEAVRAAAARAFRAAPTHHWLTEFGKQGLPIGPVRHSDELFYDEQVASNGFLARVEHELLGGMTMVAPPVHFSATPLSAQPPPPLGKHSREVLRDAGLDDDQIDELVARGAVRERDEDAAP
jgi:formyl-CoA transferase